MPFCRIILTLTIALITLNVHSGTPEINSALSPVSIEERGEMHVDGEGFIYRPWSSQTNPGKVHIVQ